MRRNPHLPMNKKIPLVRCPACDKLVHNYELPDARIFRSTDPEVCDEVNEIVHEHARGCKLMAACKSNNWEVVENIVDPRWRSNPSTEPADMGRALKMYETFHQLPKKRVTQFNCKIPDEIYHVGNAVWTYYDSAKWENKKHAYKHEHEAGVKFCWHTKEKGADDKLVDVPTWLQNTTTLVCLGDYLGGEYTAKSGETVDVETSKPYPKLFTTPNGNALVVVDGTKVVALLWGGNLHVIAPGIVG